MGMHSDMQPTYEGQKVASLGDVIGVSAGLDMNFWFGASVGAKVAKERNAVLLRDGDSWVWTHADDLKHKHGVWFPTLKQGRQRDGQRWAFMFRWSNGRKRAFDRAYPHRLQMTEEEKVELAARQEAAAARAKRWACPPESTHTMSKRARA